MRSALRAACFAALGLLLACARGPVDVRDASGVVRERTPSVLPPGGLAAGEVPQFIVLGFDDNQLSGAPETGTAGGLQWVLEQLAKRRNPPGSGQTATFDGGALHASFYLMTAAGREQQSEPPELVRRSWARAGAAGHELGIHTEHHEHGKSFDDARWRSEIAPSLELMTRKKDGLQLPRSAISGFRAPFLEYNDALLGVLESLHLEYDCSIEEGSQRWADGTNFFWPYTLGNLSARMQSGSRAVSEHPGVWELPAYSVLIPPDSRAAEFGFAPGLRKRLREKVVYFDPATGKATGFDWNLWFEYGLTGKEVVATLRHTLELRLAGNRAPLLLGLHSDIYSDAYAGGGTDAQPPERRKALEDFLVLALSHPEVRFVSAAELLGWLRRPTPLR